MTASQQRVELRKSSVSANLVHYRTVVALLVCGRMFSVELSSRPGRNKSSNNVRLRLPDAVSPSTCHILLPIYL